MISECNEESKYKIVKVCENKSTFTIINKSLFTINKVKVDGCYIKEGKKCDYLFEIIDKEIEEVFYVELKGKDISKAIEQLEHTLRKCLALHQNKTKSCYIVASRVPKASTYTQKLKKSFHRVNRVVLVIGTTLIKKEV